MQIEPVRIRAHGQAWLGFKRIPDQAPIKPIPHPERLALQDDNEHSSIMCVAENNWLKRILYICNAPKRFTRAV